MKKSYFYFILLFIHTNLQIKNKQKLIAESAYPFVLSTTNDYYYVITNSNYFKIQKESGNVGNIGTQSLFSSSNYVFITDNLNKNYLSKETDYYTIKYNEEISFEEISKNIKPSGSPSYVRIGGITKDDNFLIYGYTNDNNHLLFVNIPHNNRDCITDLKVNEHLSCKFIQGKNYICAAILDSDLHLIYLEHHFDSSEPSNNYLQLKSDINSNVYSNYYSLGLYDTNTYNIKVICGKKQKPFIADF